MSYDILSETGYKRICTCANMISDITVIIEDDSMTTDNTWSSQKIAKEILNIKSALKEYLKEDDLNKIDVSVSNILPSEDKMKENTLYVIKIFNENDLSQVLYYKIYMKFGPNIVFLGDTNIGQDTMYTKEEADTNFLCAQVAELDNLQGLAAGSLYRIFNQLVPIKINTEEVYPILSDRKNHTHAEKTIVYIHNYTDIYQGYVNYKILNGICNVEIYLWKHLNFDGYITDQIPMNIINDGSLPLPAMELNDVTPCGVLVGQDPRYNAEMFVHMTTKGGLILYGSGIKNNNSGFYRGYFSYPVM